VKEALETSTKNGGNRLGRILMTIRDEYQKIAPPPDQSDHQDEHRESPANVPSETPNVASDEPEVDPRDELLDIGEDDSDLYTRASSAAPAAASGTSQFYEEDEIDYSE
jgi:hypothetical protein